MEKLAYTEIAELFEKAKYNDEAFKELYVATSNAQYFIAFNYVENSELAKEAIQNMYITFYNHMNSIDSMAVVKWMNSTTINECRRLIRQEKYDRRVDIEGNEDIIIDINSDPANIYKRKSIEESLNKSLNKLDYDVKQVIIYRYVNNFTVKEISKSLDLSTATVNRYIKKGVTKLKKYLNESDNRLQMMFIGVPGFSKIFERAMNNQFNSVQQEDILKYIIDCTPLKVSASISAGVNTFSFGKRITKKLSDNILKITSGSIVTITVVAVVTAPSYSVNIINADYVLKQKIQVVPKGNNTLEYFDVYKDNEYISTGNKENNYIVVINNNGLYQLNIVENDGKKHTKNIYISNIDFEPPMIDVKSNDDSYEITVSDNGSGIEYDSINIVDTNNCIIPYTVNKNVISFISNEKIIIFSIKDFLGNTRTTTIYIND